MGVFLAIIVGAYAAYLGTKLTRLENEVKQLRSGQMTRAGDVPMSAPEAADIYATRMQAQEVSHASQLVTHEPSGVHQFLAWLKEDFFVKLGAFLLLVAFGWFVNYAFANNWIGPMGRITLGLVAGVCIMGLGVWRIQVQKHQGGIFTVLGSTVVLLTVFAAREVYDFFTPGIALAIMFMSVVFVAFLSVRYRSENLALAGLVLAGIAPFLTNSPEPDVFVLFSYLVVVVLGTLWVVRITGSNALTFAALVLSFFYSVPLWVGTGKEEQLIGLLFAFAFTTIFFVSNVLGIIGRTAPEARKGQIVTALFTGLFLILWVAIAAPVQWQSMLYVAWMLVFTSGAFMVYTFTRYRVPFYIYAGVGVALMAAATAVELDGALLTIAYSIQATALVLVALVLLKDITLGKNLSWLFIAPMLLSIQHIDGHWYKGLFNEDFFALIVLFFTFCITALLLFGAGDSVKNAKTEAQVLAIVGLGYLLTLIWLSTHALMNDDAAVTTSLVLYTLFGLGFFIMGRLKAKTSVATLGGLLLGFVVARLVVIDVWQMELFGRVVTFGAIGILLVSTAFIKKPHSEDSHV